MTTLCVEPVGQKLGNLKPNEALIYESVDGVVYARYRDPPYNTIPRWIIGGDSDAVNRANGFLFGYSDWKDMMQIAQTNHTLNAQMKKLLDIYYIVRNNK